MNLDSFWKGPFGDGTSAKDLADGDCAVGAGVSAGAGQAAAGAGAAGVTISVDAVSRYRGGSGACGLARKGIPCLPGVNAG